MKKINYSTVVAAIAANTTIAFALVLPPIIPGVGILDPKAWSWAEIASWPNIILNWFFWLITIWTVWMILRTALDFVNSAGDPKKMGELSTRGRNIAIGVILAILARSIPAIISTIISSSGQN
ncbi:MAG TPA: hypothetical protein PLN18_01045 [Candidatus Colwellbacteria bacterium]|nr:hypothetical protein [Candidatus Colwellbacteria bacterium]HQA95941.1 hypothetical protein [Candidatus Colwellbacteria bacterium]